MKLYWNYMDAQDIRLDRNYPDQGSLCVVKRQGAPFIATVDRQETDDGGVCWVLCVKNTVHYPPGLEILRVKIERHDQWAYLEEEDVAKASSQEQG